MNRQQAINRTPNPRRRIEPMWRAIRQAGREWGHTDGAVWLHLLKTATACLLAMGVAMLLDLPQPRIAMTTVCVLMQPLSGMVFAKSVYRIVGTGVGMVAAVVLGAVFVQQPELYILGISTWVAVCTAAAMRNRHFRWYGFVLAGYTAALIGIPVVMQPGGLFLAALGRGAEVAIGILSSGIVSAVIMPRQSASLMSQTLRIRFRDFTSFAAGVLAGGIERRVFEGRFARLVDEIVSFEATRAYSYFEDPVLRACSQYLARLNDEFMHACARLHALRQLLKRLRVDNAAIQPLAPYLAALSKILAQRPSRDETDRAFATRIARALHTFQCTLPRAVREKRSSLEQGSPDVLQDYDTAAELLYRFTTELIQYSETYAALTLSASVRETRPTRYVVKTNWYVVAFTFVRTLVVMMAMGWFWIHTDWPSGGLALIATALTCALTSSAPSAARMAVQMAVGAAFGAIAGYLYSCYVYPNVDGFVLLAAMLAPVLALGAYLAARRGIAAYGVGFLVFFCLLAGPDNVVTYAPDLLINNGIAIVSAMLVAAVAYAIVFPPHMGWLIRRMRADLRRQVVVACISNLDGLPQRFQSGTHDLMHQLRLLLGGRLREQRRALRWMLVALEVGHAVIDLRRGAADADYIGTLDGRWQGCVDRVLADLASLFERPDPERLNRALVSVLLATGVAQQVLDVVHTDRERRHDLQKLLSYLHFIRTALLDRDAPLGVVARRLLRLTARRRAQPNSRP